MTDLELAADLAAALCRRLQRDGDLDTILEESERLAFDLDVESGWHPNEAHIRDEDGRLLWVIFLSGEGKWHHREATLEDAIDPHGT